MKNKIVVSKLGHTWILDLDGTIVKHNGYKIDGEDSFLSGAMEFLNNLPPKDMIIFITSREEKELEKTEKFLKENHIRFDHMIFGAPYGERILINDCKPSGLKTGIAVSLNRDAGCLFEIEEDETL